MGVAIDRRWARSIPMEAFLVLFTRSELPGCAIARNFLSLILAAHYRKPWPILAGVFFATLANHAIARQWAVEARSWRR
jgi:Uncharacterized protein family UPF0016